MQAPSLIPPSSCHKFGKLVQMKLACLDPLCKVPSDAVFDPNGGAQL